ncbi:probable protein phosphatase 2C 14 [Rutidosis leptorrhynchoides]|uniref:probable protein phosphatase 2C 14 n=1 Tax=Rutidosis leptorrhynchoides TaxID=125765 RepID=UPI003A9A58B5
MPPNVSNLSDMSTGIINVKSPKPFTIKKQKRPPMIEIPNLLQPIEFKSKNIESKSDVVSSSTGFGVAVCSVKGRKSFMEDAHTIVSTSSEKGFFGVYDGHGGSKAADFVAKNLHSNVFEMMEKCSENTSIEEAVKAAFVKTDDEFLKQGVESGACCVTALIKDKELVISNLGDCRAVLSRNGKADALTKDHKASNEDERKRIEDKGGYVELHRGTWRVHGVLAVSRSIGDAHLKDWVLGEPETKTLPLTDDVEYLVLASDGLWDEVGKQEAIDVVTRCMASPKQNKVCQVKQLKRRVNNNWNESENDEPQRKAKRVSFENHTNKDHGLTPDGLVEACKELVNLAVTRGSLDDITVMIVDLQAFR